jgi:hypothetical protein
MGHIAHYIASEGLGKIVKGIYDKEPISDPHIMIMGIGDIDYDNAPLQVTQFEADDEKLMPQIEQLWIESGGGGNGQESYMLPWLFAAQRTEHDSIEKRNKKGYIFTIGDEAPPTALNVGNVERVIGERPEISCTSKHLLQLVLQKYEVFHLRIKEHSYYGNSASVGERWKDILGEHVIDIIDYTTLAETIITTIMINEGVDKEEALATWNSAIAGNIRTSVNFRV